MIRGSVRINTAGLTKLEAAARRRGVTSAGARAAAPVLVAAVRAQTPRDSGALYESQTVKIAPDKSQTGTVVSQGADLNHQGRNGRRPGLYDLLVNLGTRHTAPNPFRRRAYEAVKHQAARLALGAMGREAKIEIGRARVG